ncbi:MAG TPA: hypothetical protein DCL21_06830 [Alphaproteobacteria bacterium]|nr:hypothetical protein [Alphaproteobacteria bacterium]
MSRTVDVVRMFIHDGERKLLLGKRAKGNKFAGKWELPGGFVESKESMIGAIARELLEETSLTLFNYSPIKTEIDTKSDKSAEYKVNYVLVQVESLADFNHNEKNSTECWQWFAQDEMPPSEMLLGNFTFDDGCFWK